MDELLEQFLIEGRELIQQVSDDLMSLERQPRDAALLDSAFRAVHTLKGSVGLFDYPALGRVLHAAEDVMGELRGTRLAVSRDVIGSLLSAIGFTERWLIAIDNDEALPSDALAAEGRLVTRLRAHLDASELVASAHAARPDDSAWIRRLLASRPVEALPAQDDLVAVRYTPDPDCFFRGDDPIKIVRGVPDITAMRISLLESGEERASYDPFRCTLVIELLSSAAIADVKVAFRFVADQVEILQFVPEPTPAGVGTAISRPADGSARSFRVDASRIDALAEIADDLVVLKNAMADLAVDASAGLDPKVMAGMLASRQAALDRLVGRLHRTVTSVRLMPVLPLLRRFGRVVREIGASLGKEVALHIEGEGVEADKAIVDALFDPLMHIIRNAVDHGVEPAEERNRAGKPPNATLTINARRQGNRLVIEVRDDGRGLAPDAIRDAAVARGIATRAEVDALPEADALDLVFRPGFSTAERVTDISGRGVGMDAVRTSIGRLGGRASLSSIPGAGTTVRLTLPMNIVLTRVLVVECGRERYGVPIDIVVEATKVEIDRICPIRAGQAVVLRDRALPFLHLAELLDLGSVVPDVSEYRILVVRAGMESVAVAVDAILESRDVSLRPLTGILSSMPGFAGSALMGDGTVLLVLDLTELIR